MNTTHDNLTFLLRPLTEISLISVYTTANKNEGLIHLDLAASNLPVTARRMQDITLGVNWYLNPNVRIGWNYIHSQVDGADTSSAANIALMRIQIAF